MANKTLTRAELTDALVREIGLPRQECSDLLDRTIDLVGLALSETGMVKLSRFGNFIVRKKSERQGRNPKTGIGAEISARNVVTFCSSPILKKRVDSDS